MASEDLVRLLKRGGQAWNAWRADNPGVAVDLSKAGLRTLDLATANLAGADLEGADLRGAILAEANLAGACLRGANLFKAVLDGSDLAGADLRGTQFLHCAQLQMARSWQRAFRDADLACGAPIPWRPDA